MHRGYVRHWRKELDSEIMERPPLYYKVWWWVLTNVDWKTGTLLCTHDHIADRVQWRDKGHPHIPNRKVIKDILDYLVSEKMVETQVVGVGNRKGTKVSVINWHTYQQSEVGDGNINGTFKEYKHYEELEKESISIPRKRKTRVPYQASEDSVKLLVAWEKLAPLPTTTSRESCLKTFDDLHRIDGLSWERIGKICEYACKERYPTFLKSPVKLRTPTKNGKVATWEDIELNHQSHEPPRQPDEIDRIIARAHAKKAHQQAGDSDQDSP